MLDISSRRDIRYVESFDFPLPAESNTQVDGRRKEGELLVERQSAVEANDFKAATLRLVPTMHPLVVYSWGVSV